MNKILTGSLTIITLVILLSGSILALTNYDPTCISNALIKRETAIGTAYQKFISDSLSSFQKRTQGLLNAYSIEDSKERRNAIKDVWKTYKDEYKIASTELKEARKLAWKEFKSDRAICKSPKESADSESNEIRL